MRPELAATVTEADWQGFVTTTARMAGWACYHTHNSQRSEPGFPDLILIRDGQLLAWELKTEKGKVTAAQDKWLDLFRSTGADARVMRPSDQADVIAVLTAPRGTGAMILRTTTPDAPTVEQSGQDG